MSSADWRVPSSMLKSCSRLALAASGFLSADTPPSAFLMGAEAGNVPPHPLPICATTLPPYRANPSRTNAKCGTLRLIARVQFIATVTLTDGANVSSPVPAGQAGGSGEGRGAWRNGHDGCCGWWRKWVRVCQELATARAALPSWVMRNACCKVLCRQLLRVLAGVLAARMDGVGGGSVHCALRWRVRFV